MTKVSGFGAELDLNSAARNSAYAASVLGLAKRSTENLTSWAVTGSPLEKRALRSLNV